MSGLVQRTDSDCLRVGLAWALDLNYELVPDFVSESTWDKDLQDWLERRGLALHRTPLDQHPNDTKYLVYGLSSRDYHVVGALNGEVVFDPYPLGDGLITELEIWVFLKLKED